MRRPARSTRSIRALLTGTLVVGAAVAAVVTAGPASADDPTPAPDPFATQVSTPSVSPPSQEQIDDAKAALERLRNQGRSTPAPLVRVAGPTAGPDRSSVVSRVSDQVWWTVGAGLLVLLVASETTRLSVRRAKHRKSA